MVRFISRSLWHQSEESDMDRASNMNEMHGEFVHSFSCEVWRK